MYVVDFLGIRRSDGAARRDPAPAETAAQGASGRVGPRFHVARAG